MVGKASNVVLNFKMDGQVKYADTLKDINSVMNVAAKEYKNHIAAMGKDGKATDKLTAEKKKFEIQMEGAQKRTKMLSDEFEEMSKDTNTTTAELDKMYGKVLDSERAEISLQKSLDRVNNGLSDQAQEARDAQANLSDLKDENKLLNAEQKNLTSSFKLQKTELGENASEAEKVELAQKQLSEQMELTDRVMNNLDQQLKESRSAYGENSVEVMNLETKLNDAKTTVSKFSDSLEDVNSSSSDAGNGMEEFNNKLDAQNLFDTAEALEGVSDKLLEVGKSTMDSALQFGDSQVSMQANLDLTAEEAELLNEVVKDVFKNGVVGSVEEATEAVSVVKSAFENLNGVELEDLTNQITIISKRTGTEVVENTNAAKKMMDEFGISGTESLDLLAAGYQNNLNKSDDLIDTINEYAPLFAEAGYSGEEMFALLATGMENGARNTDLVADAIKEMQIRFGDGSFEDNLESFSSSTADLFYQWQNGEATMSEVLNSIATDMQDMSTSEQQEALSLLSTQFEDLGIDASLSLLSVSGGLEGVAGSAEEMSQVNPTEKLEQGFRELQELLLPVGEALLQFALNVLPQIIGAVETIYNWFTTLSEPVQTFIIAFVAITAIVAGLAPVIAVVAAAFVALNVAVLPLIPIVAGVIAAIAIIIAIFTNWGSIVDWFSEKWSQFTSWLGEAAGNMKESVVGKFTEMKDGTVGKFNELRDKGSEVIGSFKENVSNRASEMKENFVNKATELKDGTVDKFNEMKDGVAEKMGKLWETAKDIFGKVFTAITNPVETAKEFVGKAIEKIKGFFDFEWSLPPIKTPKFSLSGGFDLNPFDGDGLSVPKIGVTWNAKGGIFRQPTIFGASGGRLQGIGEAGPEAALPLNDETLGAIGQGISKNMGGKNQGIQVHNHFGQVNTNSPSQLSKINRQMKRSADFELLGKGGVPI